MVIAVIEDFCDLARLIRSLQRLEGKPECFGTGQSLLLGSETQKVLTHSKIPVLMDRRADSKL